MPQGIEVWDGNGTLVASLTDRMTRVLGKIEGSTTGVSGNITIDVASVGGGAVFFIVEPAVGNWRHTADAQYNVITANGNAISYSNLVSSFYYGVY